MNAAIRFFITMLAWAAIASQPSCPPDFIAGAAQGEPVIIPYTDDVGTVWGAWMGLEWQCRPDKDETCYAGASIGGSEPSFFLDTGP